MDGFKNSPGEFFRLPFQHFDVFPVNLVSSFELKVCSPEHFKKKIVYGICTKYKCIICSECEKSLAWVSASLCMCERHYLYTDKERAGNTLLFSDNLCMQKCDQRDTIVGSKGHYTWFVFHFVNVSLCFYTSNIFCM